MKRLLVLVFLCTVYGSDEDYFRRLDAITPETPCNRVGGVCTFAADCPNLADPGLCPAQRSQGVECCYGTSIRETRCRKQGGECMASDMRCGPVFERATDCEPCQKCCIVV